MINKIKYSAVRVRRLSMRRWFVFLFDKSVARFELSQIFFFILIDKKIGYLVMTSKKHLTVKHLNAANLQDVLLLQENIIKGLHPDEKHFILQRTTQDYKKALSGHSSNILGVFDKDKLIAQAVFILPKNNEKRDMAEFKPDIANEDLVLYEAILVDPEYRGSNLMKRMLDYIEAHALDKGRKHAIIQIAVDNPASWINALKYGMQITKVDLDPYDGAKVIYLEKNLTYNNSHHTAYKQESTYSMFLGNDKEYVKGQKVYVTWDIEDVILFERDIDEK